jgi:DNA-binding MarR family transcriptional regulator
MDTEFAFYESLKKIVACIDYGDRQLLHRYSLTVPRYFVLKHIHENPGISLTALSSLMFIDKSNTTRLINSIKEEGLVQRLRSESDHRTYCLYLSELGQELFLRASAAHNQYIQDRFSDIDMDVEVLINHLEALLRSLERECEREK